MQLSDPEIKNNLLNRLRRLEGQIKGVQGMVAAERDCREIMQQLASIHAAVQSTGRVFFQEYASACLAGLEQQADAPGEQRPTRDRLVSEMLAMLDKTP